VEAACVRRQLAFAVKLPNGDQVRDFAERGLELCAAAGHWTDAALEERYVEGGMEAIRHLGAPDWLVRVVPTIRSLSLSVRRRICGLTRRSGEPSQ
jgi:hypothetical protein